MATRKTKATGINWVERKPCYEKFQKLDLVDVIEGVVNTLVHNRKKIGKPRGAEAAKN